MTHVLLVPGKCESDFYPKTPLKNFLVGILAENTYLWLDQFIPYYHSGHMPENTIKKIFLWRKLSKIAVKNIQYLVYNKIYTK